jgi:hypothetical protein
MIDLGPLHEKYGIEAPEGGAVFGTDDRVEFGDAEAMARHIAKLFLRGFDLHEVDTSEANAEHSAILERLSNLRHVP